MVSPAQRNCDTSHRAAKERAHLARARYADGHERNGWRYRVGTYSPPHAIVAARVTLRARCAAAGDAARAVAPDAAWWSGVALMPPPALACQVWTEWIRRWAWNAPISRVRYGTQGARRRISPLPRRLRGTVIVVRSRRSRAKRMALLLLSCFERSSYTIAPLMCVRWQPASRVL